MQLWWTGPLKGRQLMASDQFEVRRYRSAKEYEADATRRLAAGWTVLSESHNGVALGQRLRKATGGAVLGSLFMMPGLGALIGGASRTDVFTDPQASGPWRGRSAVPR